MNSFIYSNEVQLYLRENKISLDHIYELWRNFVGDLNEGMNYLQFMKLDHEIQRELRDREAYTTTSNENNEKNMNTFQQILTPKILGV